MEAWALVMFRGVAELYAVGLIPAAMGRYSTHGGLKGPEALPSQQKEGHGASPRWPKDSALCVGLMWRTIIGGFSRQVIALSGRLLLGSLGVCLALVRAKTTPVGWRGSSG